MSNNLRFSVEQEVKALLNSLVAEKERFQQEKLARKIASIKDERTAEFVAELLCSDDGFIRNIAIEVLVALDEKALNVLKEKLKDKNRIIRKFALDALKQIKGSNSCEIAVLSLDDEDENVVEAALEVIAEQRYAKAEDKLHDLLIKTKSVWIINSLIRTVGSIGAKHKHVYIEIEDDGKGIDSEVLKRKAIDKGFITSADAERMSHNQLLNLIFLPGFSTAKQITEISGRGVGMDIVKSNISKINGNVMIESEVNKGTKMIIQLPLSLAVSRGLIVNVSGETFIIPLDYIAETVKLNRGNIQNYNGKYFTYFRGNVIRVEWLCKIFQTGEDEADREELNAVILSNGNENFAIVVDKLKNEQEFVVKTLEGHLASIPGISGSTLLGNGQVVLIVNPMDLLQLMEK